MKIQALLRYPQKIILDILIVALIFIVVELAARTLFHKELQAWNSPVPIVHEGKAILQGNPYLLFEYVPGVWEESGVSLRINSLGLRGAEITTPKPMGTRRLLTVGDSSVFGFGVAEEYVFSSVLSKMMGESVEVINGGIPGYSTYQSINMLNLRGWDTQPDVLIIGSLWSDNNFGSFVDKEMLAMHVGFANTTTAKLHRMLSYSAIYQLADWRRRVKVQADKVSKVGPNIHQQKRSGKRRVEVNDYANNLDVLVVAAHERGAEVLFLILPNENDLNDPPETFRGWEIYRKVIRDTAARYGAPIIDAPKIFQETGLPSTDLFIDKMHPSVKGHQVLATALHKQLLTWSKGEKLEKTGSGAVREKYQDTYVMSHSQDEVVSLISPEGATAKQEPKKSAAGSMQQIPPSPAIEGSGQLPPISKVDEQTPAPPSNPIPAELTDSHLDPSEQPSVCRPNYDFSHISTEGGVRIDLILNKQQQLHPILIDVVKKLGARYDVIYHLNCRTGKKFSFLLPPDMGDVQLHVYSDVDNNGPSPSDPKADSMPMKLGKQNVKITLDLVVEAVEKNNK